MIDLSSSNKDEGEEGENEAEEEVGIVSRSEDEERWAGCRFPR